MIGRYWVGERPLRRVPIDLLDSTGSPVDLRGYTHVTARMRDTNNRDVDMNGTFVDILNPDQGKLSLTWPSDRSLFNKPGEYVVQLVLHTDDSIDYSNVQTLQVLEFGSGGAR